ncbi:MAG: class I SAM-dependent rRNA methyltransferase [Bacteroidales bacterium]|nr:class I SAM-dependent rRNA methyltransferase [Bacteroidales bacterium]
MNHVIQLRKGREDSLLRFHPWVFSGAVASIDGKSFNADARLNGEQMREKYSLDEGDLVEVLSANGDFLAAGHFQVGSILVRILSFDDSALRPNFFQFRLSQALDVRKRVMLTTSPETNCYRLVHGEGDNLPGLIIDYYDGVCVLQAHSAGMFKAREEICAALRKVYGKNLKAVYDKSSDTAPFKAGLELKDGYLYKAPDFSDDEQTVLENGHKFIVNWTEGQKTGFFLDQRENRRLVGKYAKDASVLNLFCYTGGFSIYALASGARLVDSVDCSAKAMTMVDRNVELNFDKKTCTKHTSHCCDAIEFVKAAPEDRYDLIIVDPPAFAKHRGALKNALRAYQRLNAAAISKVAKGGLVFTFSCSQVVDKEAFALAIFSAAAQVGRRVRILDRLNQPADHSVNIYHPEGEYLKGLLLYVE